MYSIVLYENEQIKIHILLYIKMPLKILMCMEVLCRSINI